MKKAIIILSLLSAIILGLNVYEGYLYIESLNTLNEAERSKAEQINNNLELEKENIKLEGEYNQKSHDLILNNINCELWKKLEETLKKIKE